MIGYRPQETVPSWIGKNKKMQKSVGFWDVRICDRYLTLKSLYGKLHPNSHFLGKLKQPLSVCSRKAVGPLAWG